MAAAPGKSSGLISLLLMTRGGQTYSYIYDGLGSVIALTNSSGSVTDAYTYDAFGEGLSHSGSSVNDFLFDGQQYDGASADYYLRARFYDETSGRFLSQDPFGGNSKDPITLHRYLYAGDDPVDNVDPGGELDFSLNSVLTCVGIVGTISSVYNFITDPTLVTGAQLALSLIPGSSFARILDAAGELKGFGALRQIAIGLKNGVPLGNLRNVEPSSQAAVSWLAAHGSKYIIWATDKTIGKIIGTALGSVNNLKRTDVFAQDVTDGSYVIISAKSLLTKGELLNAVEGLGSTVEGLDRVHELGSAAFSASENISKLVITYRETKGLAALGYSIDATGRVLKDGQPLLVKGLELFAKKLNF